MPRACALFFFLLLAGFGITPGHAQTPLPGPEPKFPPSCIVLRADAAVRMSVQSALDHCRPGSAVELAPGIARQAHSFSFVIDPITLPQGVSLIVDGGVTVYGTTDASLYQIPNPGGATCGTIGTFPIYGVCKPLIRFTSGSGIYGYGIIDGQGEKDIT